MSETKINPDAADLEAMRARAHARDDILADSEEGLQVLESAYGLDKDIADFAREYVRRLAAEATPALVEARPGTLDYLQRAVGEIGTITGILHALRAQRLSLPGSLQ